MDGARTALPNATPELGARQAHNIAQHPQKRHVPGGVHAAIFAIDMQSNHWVTVSQPGTNYLNFTAVSAAMRTSGPPFRPALRARVWDVVMATAPV
jgi:hypothetical protein